LIFSGKSDKGEMPFASSILGLRKIMPRMIATHTMNPINNRSRGATFGMNQSNSNGVQTIAVIAPSLNPGNVALSCVDQDDPIKMLQR
jgi:hypothetical protein